MQILLIFEVLNAVSSLTPRLLVCSLLSMFSITQYVVFMSAFLSYEFLDAVVLFIDVSSASLNAWHLQEQNKYLFNWVEIKTGTECALCIPVRLQPENHAKTTRKPSGEAELEEAEWGTHRPKVVQIVLRNCHFPALVSPWPVLFLACSA